MGSYQLGGGASKPPSPSSRCSFPPKPTSKPTSLPLPLLPQFPWKRLYPHYFSTPAFLSSMQSSPLPLRMGLVGPRGCCGGSLASGVGEIGQEQ